MSEKASGNENPSSESTEVEKAPSKVEPIGEEVSVDPEAGDLLDPVDRWWSDSKEEKTEEDGPRNRKLDPEEAERLAEKARKREEEIAKKSLKEKSDSDGDPPVAGDVASEEDEEKETIGESDSWRDDLESTSAEDDEPKEQEKTPVETGLKKEDRAKAVLEGDLPPIPVVSEEARDDDASISDSRPGGGTEAVTEEGPEKSPVEENSEETRDENVEEIAIDPADSPEPSLKVDANSEEEESSDDESESDEKVDSKEEDASESAPSEDEEETTVEKSAKPEGDDDSDSDVETRKESEKDDSPEDETESSPASEEDAVFAVGSGKASNKAKRKGGCWSVFTNLFFFGSLLLLLAIAAASFYAYSQWGKLEETISGTVESELAKRGYFVDYGGWRYQFPRGIVVEDISLYETSVKERAVLTASDVGVNIDFLKALKDWKSLGAAQVTFDDSELVFFHAGEQVGSMIDLDAEILASKESVKVQRFAALVGGVQVRLTGDLDLAGAGEGEEAEVAESNAEESVTEPPSFAWMRDVAPYLDVTSEGSPPVLEVEFFHALDREGELKAEGELKGENFAWRDISVSSVLANFRYTVADKVVEVPGFQMKYGEGMVSGDLSFDTESKMITVRECQSSVDLVRLLSDFSEDLKTKLAMVDFIDAPLVRLKGTVPIETPAESQVTFSYDHRGGMNLLLDEKVLKVESLGGDFTYERGGLQTDNFTASLFEGILQMNGIVRVTNDPIPFRGLINLTEMSLAEIGTYFAGEDLGLSGDVFLTFNGAGYAEITRISGGGTLRIDDAKLRSFPVIGPVQGFLGKVIPAFGIDENGSVRGAYVFESGVLVTNDLTVIQSGAKLRTNAMVRMESQYVDFTSTATLEETLAKATGLEGKEIVVEGEGNLDDVSMSLSGFPVEFATEKLSGVLGTSPETLSNLKDAIGDPASAAKILGQQLTGENAEEGGVDLGEEIGGLLRGLLESGEDAEESEEAEPVRGRAVPIEPEE